jgi:hypothetical protein
MQVEYDKKYRYEGQEVETRCLESVSTWIQETIQEGGFESQLRKITNLLSIVGEQWVINNQHKLNEVVEAIECRGTDHRLTDKEW